MRRLREDEVSTYSESSYAKLIGDFVNESKREVEDSWNWTHLRTSIPVTTVASTDTYTLTGSGERFRIMQAINDTQDTEMSKVPYTYMNKQKDMSSFTNDSPMYYSVIGQSSGDMSLTVLPTPNAVETLNFYGVAPQADLAADGTEISVPYWPVLLGAYAKAILERGEEGGTSLNASALMAQTALTDAIAIDAGNTPSELNWVVT